jgi:hemimethylated DNA binding protein
MKLRIAKFAIGQIVKHRKYPFRGIVYDVDPVFANTEEWWQSIPPELRPRKDQPFYHLFAENADIEYVAYVRAKSHGRYIRRSHSPSASKRDVLRALMAPIKSKGAIELKHGLGYGLFKLRVIASTLLRLARWDAAQYAIADRGKRKKLK